jgi:hypothetical protein
MRLESVIAGAAVAAAVFAGLPPAPHVTVQHVHPRAEKLDAGEAQTCRELLETVYGDGPSHATTERRIVIATVPDPVSSGVAASFDQLLDAIQRALAAHGETLQGYWLPWGKKDSSGRPCERDVPGVLRASAPGEEDRRGRGELVVFLVGEAPAGGINANQFEVACYLAAADGAEPPCVLSESKKAVGPRSHRSARVLGVLGPSFSGSSESLERLLGGRLNGQVVSGTATMPNFPFRRTTLDDNIVQQTLLAYIAKAAGVIPKRDIALLVEGNTQYGQGFQETPDKNAKASRCESAGEADAGFRPKYGIPFPLHIHQLRMAVPTSDPVGTGDPALSTIPLEPDDSVGSTTVAQFSKSSAAYDELSLEVALQGLARDEVRYIGIVATDDQDKLYLARRVRAFCPNAALFTFETSLLLTHPDYARVTQGMLVASAYPLIALNQNWTSEKTPRSRVQFATASAEGTYNALLVLLDDDPGPSARTVTRVSGLESPPGPTPVHPGPSPSASTVPAKASLPAKPRPELLLEQRGPFGFHPTGPPVWITVVGNGGFWPVAVAPTSDDEATGWTWLHHRPVAPWGARLAFALFTIWLALRLGSFWTARMKWQRWTLFGDTEAAAALEASPEGAEPQGSAALKWIERRRTLVTRSLGALFGLATLGYGIVLVFALTPTVLFGPRSTDYLLLWGTGTLLFAAAATAILAGQKRPGVKALSALGCGALGGSLVLLGVTVFSPRGAMTLDRVNWLLTWERTIALSNGVSPLVPIALAWFGGCLALQAFVWSVTHSPLAMQGVEKEEVEELKQAAGAAANIHPAFTFFAVSAKPVLNEDPLGLVRPFWKRCIWLGVALLLAVPFLGLSRIHEAPVDGRTISGVLVFCAFLLTTTIGWALFRVLEGTSLLERALRLFATGPLHERIRAFYKHLPAKQFGRLQPLRPTVRLLAEAHRAWQALGRWKPEAEGKQLQEDLLRLADCPAWGSRSFELLRRASVLAALEAGEPGSSKQLTRLVGWFFVLFVSWGLGTIRLFLVLAAALSACLWLVFLTYPQSPHQMLLIGSLALMSGTLILGISVLFRFERNELLSEMSRTEVGKVNFDASSLKTVGTLLAGPVLAVLVLEFPQLGRWMAEWGEPLLRTMK